MNAFEAILSIAPPDPAKILPADFRRLLRIPASIILKEEVVRLLQSALVTLLIGAGFLSQPPPSYRVESEPVADGAELVTVFGRLHDPASGSQDLDVPLLTVLRDSLGDSDPANDRLRYVWILTSTRPTPWQRAASALSFGFFRAGSKRHANRVPSPALDLASPYTKRLRQSVRRRPAGAGIRSAGRRHSIHHPHLSRQFERL